MKNSTNYKKMFITVVFCSIVIGTTILIQQIQAQIPPSNPCGPSDNSASQYAPGGPGGYPPGQNPFNPAPGGAPGQLKQNQGPLP